MPAMRSIKKVSITFGPVNVPVKVMSAVEKQQEMFHLHHNECAAKGVEGIHMERFCDVCGEMVAYADLVKGVERDGRIVVVTSEDLNELADAVRLDSIEIKGFVNADRIDPIYYDSTYFLEADAGPKGKSSTKPYALLREALKQRAGMVPIVEFALRDRATQGVLVIRDEKVMTIHTLRWHDQIRTTEQLTNARREVTITDREMAAATKLIDAMSKGFKWEPEKVTDPYMDGLNDLIEAKVAGNKLVADDDGDDAAGELEVSDLLDKLEAAVAASESAEAKPKRRRTKQVKRDAA